MISVKTIRASFRINPVFKDSANRSNHHNLWKDSADAAISNRVATSIRNCLLPSAIPGRNAIRLSSSSPLSPSVAERSTSLSVSVLSVPIASYPVPSVSVAFFSFFLHVLCLYTTLWVMTDFIVGCFGAAEVQNAGVQDE